MKIKLKKAPVFMRRTANGLSPSHPIDQETLEAYPIGCEVEISAIKRKRSLPEQRLYWLLLHRIVKATGKWPTKERLHEVLLYDLGYAQPVLGLKGDTHWIRVSTDFESMDEADFKPYFDQAIELLSASLGIDPTTLLKEEKEK